MRRCCCEEGVSTGTIAADPWTSVSASASSRMTLGRSKGSVSFRARTCCPEKGCAAAFVELTVDAEAVGGSSE